MARTRTAGGDGFSRLVSEITRIMCDDADAHMEVDAYYAPSECHRDVTRSTEREIARTLAAAGMTPAEFDAELERRTSPRWAFFSGLLVER